MQGLTKLITSLFSSFETDANLAKAIENNQPFSSSYIEVKPTPIGPNIIIKANNEDELIEASKHLTRVCKLNPTLRTKIYLGLKTDFPSSYFDNSYGDFGYKGDTEEVKDKAALELIEAIQASEAILHTPNEDGEASFGYNPVSDKLYSILSCLDRERFPEVVAEFKEKKEAEAKPSFFKKHKKTLFGATAALALGSCIAYPSIVKGELSFDPMLTLGHIINAFKANPHYVFHNINPMLYTITAFTTNSEKSSKKKIYALGLFGAALSGFAFVALTDLDGDKVNGWNEMFKYRTNPIIFNPVLKYVDKKISDDNLVRALLPLEVDGLSDREKSFIDYLIPLDKQLQYMFAHKFLSDNRISMNEKWLLDYATNKGIEPHILLFLHPLADDLNNRQSFIDYLSTLDKQLQHKLVEGFLADYELSEDEAKKLNLLQTYADSLDKEAQIKIIDSLIAYKTLDDIELKKLKIALDYISSLDKQLQQKVTFGFLEDNNISIEEAYQIKFLQQLSKQEQTRLIEVGSFTDIDIDKDGMSNYFEKVIAGMPWDVYNGRYAIILCDEEVPAFYDNKTFLINDLKFKPENVKLCLGNNYATFDNFLNIISEWEKKVTENDIVYISIHLHGHIGILGFTDKIVTYEEIDKQLDRLKPMKMLIVNNACFNVSSFEPLKSGPSPRVITNVSDAYFRQTSKNFVREHYAPKPEAFDLDGNNYVSIAEIIEIQNKIFKDHHYAWIVEYVDPYNILPTFYLGDLRVKDTL